ncbi:Hpt domain-containing protein [Defluviimonas aestuarii]|uniref:Hpt domain-containing protein n=1 Tax=Albidovulum aestuarii TaxID=1130726 RepID=UPI00249B6CDF|nr:Hpt domain-containing protein [Defluviimonas aestuarii]MDI3338852.1 Hpt domain-containing protein [Defluviimonas aestuarii]
MSDAKIDGSAIERLLGVIGGDRDDLLELLDEFFVVAPDYLRKMQEAALSGDLDNLRIASHSLKSNSRDFGAVDLAGLCQSLEHACKSGAVSDAASQVAAIDAAFAAAKTSLNKLVVGNG